MMGCYTADNPDLNQNKPQDGKSGGPLAPSADSETLAPDPQSGCYYASRLPGSPGGGDWLNQFGGGGLDGGYSGDDSGIGTSFTVGDGDLFAIIAAATTPTGTYRYDGTVNNEPVWLTGYTYGNIDLLSLLGGGPGGPAGGGDPGQGGAGGATRTGPCNKFQVGGAIMHVFDEHIAPGNEYNKSKYDVKNANGFDTDIKKMNAVMALNEYVFAHSTPQMQYTSQGTLWSFVYTVNVPKGTSFTAYPDPNSTEIGIPLITVNIVGTLAGKLGGGPTNDATLVLDPNCNMRTSFPGKPLKTP
jgi:hypothetical protein